MRIVPVPVETGKTWEEAVDKLGTRPRELVLTPLSSIRIKPDDCSLMIGERSFGITTWAARQLAARLRISSQYVLRIDNEAAAYNFNHFLPNAYGSAQAVVEDGETVTGFLNERTVPVPVKTLAEQASERLTKDGYELAEWRSDDTGTTFRMASAKLKVEPRKGDIVRIGIDLWNNENTEGGLMTRGIAFRLFCTNGATAPEPMGLGRQIRREGWRDPSARIDLAFNAVRTTTDMVREMGDHLKDLAGEKIDWQDEYTSNLAIVRSGMAHIDGRPIRGEKFGQSVVETMDDEEKTAYGLYNALTRIGRDSLDTGRRALFESAGFQFALRPADPLRALHEAAEAFSNN